MMPTIHGQVVLDFALEDLVDRFDVGTSRKQMQPDRIVSFPPTILMLSPNLGVFTAKRDFIADENFHLKNEQHGSYIHAAPTMTQSLVV